MTVIQGAELIQTLVKNGVIRGKDTLSRQAYVQLAIVARDYIIFQKKQGGDILTTNASVVSQPSEYVIQNNQVILPQGYNVQGITALELLTKGGGYLEHSVFPLYAGAKNIVDNMFTYYIPLAGSIEFKNLPFNAKRIKLYSVAGSDLNDNISNDIMYLILKEVMSLGQMSEEKRKDTSADGNTTDDILQAQIRTQTNVPNQVV
jgi:hypothetical protein